MVTTGDQMAGASLRLTSPWTGGDAHTAYFGLIPKELLATVQVSDVLKVREEYSRNWQALTEEQHLESVDRLRTLVGALWLRLLRESERDIDEAYTTSESFWHCVFTSFRGRLHPQRFYRVCGSNNSSFSSLIMDLCNALPTEELRKKAALKWGYRDWMQHVDGVATAKTQMREKEKEYRDAANVILQVGIGWGGMVLGVIGLALSLLIPLLPFGPK